MKKVLLSLLVLAGTVGYSQTAISDELRVSEKEAAQIQSLLEQKKQSANKKNTAGGTFTNEFYSFTETVYDLYGGSSTFGLFLNPMWQDSTVKEEFSNATQYIGNHAIGMVFDPASSVWGANQFDSTDAYSVDSVYILGSYRTPRSIPNPMGDSLIVEVVWAPINDAATWNTGGISYSGTSPDSQCDYATPNYSATTNSPEDFKLSATNKLRVGIELSSADTAGPTTSAWYGIAVNQQIPSGNIVGVNWYFKSAYSSSLSVGDTVFSTVTPKDVAAPSFAGRIIQDNNLSASNFFMYFCDPGYFGGHNAGTSAGSDEAYNSGASTQWPSMFPETYNGQFVGLSISGTSTVGIEENEVNKMALYPNPTSGKVTFEIAQRGTYNINVLNVLGQVVYSEEVRVDNGEKLNRDFSNLNKGIYLVNMTANGVTNTTKLTIE